MFLATLSLCQNRKSAMWSSVLTESRETWMSFIEEHIHSWMSNHSIGLHDFIPDQLDSDQAKLRTHATWLTKSNLVKFLYNLCAMRLGAAYWHECSRQRLHRLRSPKCMNSKSFVHDNHYKSKRTDTHHIGRHCWNEYRHARFVTSQAL